MTDRLALNKLAAARDPSADRSGAKIWSYEARAVVDELRAADPNTGKPAGKFSDTALKLLSGDSVVVEGSTIAGVRSSECSSAGYHAVSSGAAEARRNLWNPGTSEVVSLPVKDDHAVFLTKGRGFAIDASGTLPRSSAELGAALFSAGEWVQASFDSSHNLFATAGLDIEAKKAVLAQFKGQVESPLSDLNNPQAIQLLGNIAGLLVELIKSVDVTSPVPGDRAAQRSLISESFGLLKQVLDDERLSVPVKQQLLGYLNSSDTFNAQLLPAERQEITTRFRAMNPEFPFDYAAWDRAGKSTINVDHIAGLGEGFLYGFSKWLQQRGLGDASWRNGSNTFRLVHGDEINGPARLEVTVPASDPINKWGRDMKINIDLRYFRNDMLSGLGKPEVDITGYDGHSNFGNNTLQSIASAPEQQGPKLFYRWVCAGVDADNAVALRAPEAFANSYTTQDSGYFRKTTGPAGVGEYAYEAEGWEGIRCMIRGVLGKKSHKEMQADMKAHANWWGHSPGNDNNCVGPGDARRGGSGDWDQDGIPNMFDVMPTVNTFDVAASTAKEFELKVPNIAADEIRADRAFQAIQFVNTATNYNTYLHDLNLNRKINAHPEGVWFDGLSDPNTYVRFAPGPDGTTTVQLSSALADMTIEALRVVLFYETARHLLERSNTFRTPAEKTAAALLFGTSALKYDIGYRDQPIYEGLRKFYGIPDSVTYADIDRAVRKGEEAHDYTGNNSGVREIVEQHGAALSGPNVGKPAIPVTA